MSPCLGCRKDGGLKKVSVDNQEGKCHGLVAFANANRSLSIGSEYDAVFRKYLRQVQDKTKWIAGDVSVDVYFFLG